MVLLAKGLNSPSVQFSFGDLCEEVTQTQQNPQI